jgi:menaquinone-dependent protoporphyrinogen oxidase
MKTSVLIVFHSSAGQTATIARRIAFRLEEQNVAATVVDAKNAPAPAGFDVVVLGDSIHEGHHSDALIDYAEKNCAALGSIPLAAFQVSITSAWDDEESAQVAAQMMDDFCRDVGITPDQLGLFAGAFAFSRYRGMQRFLMQHVARESGFDTDLRTDQSFTDWEAVDGFADDVLRLAGTPED